MNDTDVRDLLARVADEVPATPLDPEPLLRRGYGRMARTAVAVALAAAAIAVATVAGFDAIRSAPIPADRPTPSVGILRTNGEVLTFTGDPRWSHRTPGDLVAVNPETGQERVLVEDIHVVYSARWSADGRWVAYETLEQGDVGLWVVGASQEPRQVATGGQPYILAPFALGWVVWSPTGAELAAIDRSTLITIDPVSGETTDLASIDAAYRRNAVLTPTPAWSPDGRRIAFGGRDWAVYSVDVRSGERSLLVRLPGEDEEEFHMVDEILWSPDGAHIAVMNGSRLYIMDADGSNVRVVGDEFDPMGVAWSAWSPDGTRFAFAEASQPDEEIRIRVAPMDGAAPAEIGSLPLAGCAYNFECGLTWSPDGSKIAFRKHKGEVTAFDANGAGEVGPIDELTYRSWDGGWYSCTKCA
jgi:Tol biopolymer transport system component